MLQNFIIKLQIRAVLYKSQYSVFIVIKYIVIINILRKLSYDCHKKTK